MIGGVACSGRDVVELAMKERPDVVVLDYWLIGDLNSIETARTIRSDLPGTQVLVLSPAPGPPQVQSALEAGAAGFPPRAERRRPVDARSVPVVGAHGSVSGMSI